MTFRVGEWIFCEFKLAIVRRVANDRVTCIADGCSELSGDLQDRCRPLTYRMKQIADRFDYTWERLVREGPNGLNYPAIHRWLVDQWIKACAVEDDGHALDTIYQELREFENEMLTVRHLETRYGFRLFRG